jgi:ubiquinone/menaquinone biosynthesis C-methylase UbiE
MIPFSILALWSGASALATRAFDVNGRASMPTQNFLRSGSGRILDLGAGTGRSSIMVLEARPKATLVALDLFGGSFDTHFGGGVSPQQRLLSNLTAAGVEDRATIMQADMRKLPFEPATFDAIVSSYAIDHLNGKGIDETLHEANRVVKPGGEFLLMVINKDKWLKFTFGPALLHAGFRGGEWWASHVQAAGFAIVEQGTVPATVYIVARRPPV